MTRVRILLLLGVLALIVALVPAASAQETFGLTQEEYDALVNANANSTAASSYDYAFTMNLDATASGDGFSMALDGSGAVSDGFSMNVTGTLSAEGESLPAQLGLVVAGDMLYISLDGGTTWYGGTAEELLGMATGMTGGMLPVDPAALASGDLSGLEGQMGDMSGMMTGLEDLDATQFVSITAAPDGDTTVYTLTLDLAGLLSTPEMGTLLGTAMLSSGAMGSSTEQPSQEELAMMGQMMGGMFATATATITQTVDTAAGVVTQTVLNIGIPMDAMGSAGDGINITFDISLSNYNAAAPVEAPASSQPIGGLLSGLMGGMSGM